uniref:Uncharacterized protein n=1 Tax=Arundo donax TaxID=35708 RepID=A0A0A9AVH5_ARUDO
MSSKYKGLMLPTFYCVFLPVRSSTSTIPQNQMLSAKANQARLLRLLKNVAGGPFVIAFLFYFCLSFSV